MKIVILEADSLGQDMVFTPFEALGEVVIYRSTTADEMEEKTRKTEQKHGKCQTRFQSASLPLEKHRT